MSTDQKQTNKKGAQKIKELGQGLSASSEARLGRKKDLWALNRAATHTLSHQRDPLLSQESPSSQAGKHMVTSTPFPCLPSLLLLITKTTNPSGRRAQCLGSTTLGQGQHTSFKPLSCSKTYQGSSAGSNLSCSIPLTPRHQCHTL